MLVENNPADTVQLLINGTVGKHEFCENCDEYETCDYAKQRVPWCCMQAIEFYNRNKFGSDYPFPGGYMGQPVWLSDLSSIVGDVIAKNKKGK